MRLPYLFAAFLVCSLNASAQIVEASAGYSFSLAADERLEGTMYSLLIGLQKPLLKRTSFKGGFRAGYTEFTGSRDDREVVQFTTFQLGLSAGVHYSIGSRWDVGVQLQPTWFNLRGNVYRPSSDPTFSFALSARPELTYTFPSNSIRLGLAYEKYLTQHHFARGQGITRGVTVSPSALHLFVALSPNRR